MNFFPTPSSKHPDPPSWGNPATNFSWICPEMLYARVMKYTGIFYPVIADFTHYSAPSFCCLKLPLQVFLYVPWRISHSFWCLPDQGDSQNIFGTDIDEVEWISTVHNLYNCTALVASASSVSAWFCHCTDVSTCTQPVFKWWALKLFPIFSIFSLGCNCIEYLMYTFVGRYE